MRSPWTRDELNTMLRSTERRIEATEAEMPGVRPVPLLLEDECRKLMDGLLDKAELRVLTREESFLFGQLLAQYRMAVQAAVLGKKGGRYFVISEDDIERRLHIPTESDL